MRIRLIDIFSGLFMLITSKLFCTYSQVENHKDFGSIGTDSVTKREMEEDQSVNDSSHPGKAGITDFFIT